MVSGTVMWVDIREPHTDKLLLRFDPARDIIEVQRRGVKTVIDLTQYKERQGATEEIASGQRKPAR
jgi:hypothetical protein